MSTVAVSDRLSFEARVRPRQGVIAVLAGVFLVGSAIAQLAGPHTNVAEVTLGLITEHKRFGLDIASAVVQALGWLAVASTLWFLFSSVRARDPKPPPAFMGYLSLIGAALAAIGIVGYITVYGIKANQFVTHGTQTYPQANHLLSAASLAIFQVMDYAGELLLAIAFVITSLQAMRTGLLTRFMGYLGIIAGILVLFVITPVPVVQGYWLIALGILLYGRWPTGTPPAWDSGQVEKWPSSQEMREQRQREAKGSSRRGKPAPKSAPQPVVTGTATPAQRAPRSETSKRKRKRRK
jgi:hypothetical protein